jgi:hypothetical protein
MKTDITKLILLLAAVFCSAASRAQTVYTSGSTTVTVSAGGDTVTVSGTGAMAGGTPWSGSLDAVTTVIVEPGVTAIGDYAFNNATNLTSVTLPEGLTAIGIQAFYQTGLTAVVFPASVAAIGNFAFRGIAGLTAVSFLGVSPPAFGITVFWDIAANAAVTVPAGAEEYYASALSSEGIWGGASLHGGGLLTGYRVETVVVPAGTGTVVVDDGASAATALFTAAGSVTVAATAKPGYAFEYWTVDNEIVSTPSFSLKTRNITIVAHFRKALISFSPAETTFNGLPKSVTVETGDGSIGEITKIYYVHPNGRTTETPPVEVGEYDILVDIAPCTAYPLGVSGLRLGIFRIAEPSAPPSVTHAVTLPAFAGIVTYPAAGRHYTSTVNNSFEFVIRPSAAYSGLTPLVTTEPAIDTPPVCTPNVDGTYTVTLSGIRQEIRINIDFVAAVAGVDATKVWSAGGQLYVTAAQAGEAQVYNLLGQLTKTVVLAGGETAAVSLSVGVYIVTLNGAGYKVYIEN